MHPRGSGSGDADRPWTSTTLARRRHPDWATPARRLIVIVQRLSERERGPRRTAEAAPFRRPASAASTERCRFGSWPGVRVPAAISPAGGTACTRGLCGRGSGRMSGFNTRQPGLGRAARCNPVCRDQPADYPVLLNASGGTAPPAGRGASGARAASAQGAIISESSAKRLKKSQS